MNFSVLMQISVSALTNDYRMSDFTRDLLDSAVNSNDNQIGDFEV